jgi:hypothetical protein
MLARKSIADGGTLCPRPWRGRKRIGSPSMSANSTSSDGVPQGEAIASQRTFLSAGMS